MIKIEKTDIVGWEAAIRGMRNPMNSWEKSDSCPVVDCETCRKFELEGVCTPGFNCFYIGPNDVDLMTRLRNAGTDHRKFMRMITVYVDITAPLYWWKEFDTYKVGTVANSCSTMHKIHAKEFTVDDFSHEHLADCELTGVDGYPDGMTPMMVLSFTIDMLNYYRRCYIEDGKTKNDWWQMIQLLPSSYNQKRTVLLNYEVLANMYKSRKNHKLDEWRELCEWIDDLPYSELLIAGGDD